MIIEIKIAMFILLGIYSYMDIKSKQIPSIFLTAGLFMMIVLMYENLYFGLLSLVLGVLLLEAGSFQGIADVKVLTFLGLSISTYQMFFPMLIMIGVFGLFWSFIEIKYAKEKEISFIPVFLMTFIGLNILEVVV